jgi:hypothetical protein
LKELETRVRQLPKADLVKFTEWFDVFREANVLTGDALNDIDAAQREELLRRRDEFLANPSLASDWDDGFFERLRQRLIDARSQETAGG